MTGDEKKAIHKCIHLKKFGIHTHTHTHTQKWRTCGMHLTLFVKPQKIVLSIRCLGK